MIFANIVKKWNVRLTIIDPVTGPEEKIIGQLWEYLIPGHKEPDHYHFAVKYLPEFDGLGFHSDGNDDKQSLLEHIKGMYQYTLNRFGVISNQARLLFSLSPIEQVF